MRLCVLDVVETAFIIIWCVLLRRRLSSGDIQRSSIVGSISGLCVTLGTTLNCHALFHKTILPFLIIGLGMIPLLIVLVVDARKIEATARPKIVPKDDPKYHAWAKPDPK